MRIGIFTDTYPPYINGVSTSVYMLKKALERKGHQVFVVTINNESLHYKFDEDDTVIRIPGLPIGIYDYRLSFIYPIRAMNIIRKWKLDVIHSHTEFGVGTFARIISRQFNIPLVHTYHTMYEDYTHYITRGYFEKSSKKIVEYLTLFYCDKTANELIVPTKKTYDLFKEKYEVDKNIYIIPTGIEIDRFFIENVDNSNVEKIKKKLNIVFSSFNIVFVGRLAKEKNVDLLLSAHKNIIKEKKDINLIIIGDGPDMDEYKETSKKLGIEKNVIFVGKVPWEDIPAYYRVADVFATASKSETQGLTVIEAMAASVAPICIDDESFRNTVIDGLNGRIFETQDEYEKIVLELYKDKKQLDQLQRQARLNAEVHSSKYYAESVLDVYKHVIDNKQNDNYGVIGKLVDKLKSKEDFNETDSGESEDNS
ncbi:MAG: glycosyltransferase family 4 protein [Bacilli bacterium]|nr:glycosyltransferase family 4 protein [Bacilli bacterium]